MRTTLIAATALTLSAAALAQGYGTTPVDDGAGITQPEPQTDAAASTATEQVAPDPLIDEVAPEAATTTTPVQDTATADAPAQANLQTFAGMGGPYEEVYGSSSGTLNLQPRPAEQNYPPCSPGPGDDNCIQLYESGVRQQLASWNQPTGGLADGTATTAMGGPYEPVADTVPADSATAESSASAPGSTTVDEPAETSLAKPAASDAMPPATTSEAEVPEPKLMKEKA